MADEFADWAVLALSALAHESRLQVHRLLVQAGEDGMSAGAIAEQLGLPASSLSFHLAHMQAAEMVTQRRDGRSLIYSVNFECMDALMAYLQENCCKGRLRDDARPHQPGMPLPVAIIGAGPVGLAAAAQLALRDQDFVVFERGARPGAAVAEWGHVTFFSPWRYVVDDGARQLLEATGWSMPDPDRDPTGRELIDHYLAPLAAHPAIAPHLRLRCPRRLGDPSGHGPCPLGGTRGAAVRDRHHRSRRRTRPATSPARSSTRRARGTDRTRPARAVCRHAARRAAAARISYGIPDVFGTKRERFAGRRVMVIGSGHSAMDSILGLARLRQRGTRHTRSCGRCVRRRPSGPSVVSTTTSWPVAARSANEPRPPSTAVGSTRRPVPGRRLPTQRRRGRGDRRDRPR